MSLLALGKPDLVAEVEAAAKRGDEEESQEWEFEHARSLPDQGFKSSDILIAIVFRTTRARL